MIATLLSLFGLMLCYNGNNMQHELLQIPNQQVIMSTRLQNKVLTKLDGYLYGKQLTLHKDIYLCLK